MNGRTKTFFEIQRVALGRSIIATFFIYTLFTYYGGLVSGIRRLHERKVLFRGSVAVILAAVGSALCVGSRRLGDSCLGLGSAGDIIGGGSGSSVLAGSGIRLSSLSFA